MSTSQHKGHGKRIVLVDDHPIVRNGLAVLLSHERDLTVSGQAASAAEALAILAKSVPDLIVVDISIAGTNGIELTKILRERYPSLPALILSMHDEDVYAERALRAGAKGYVMKQESPDVVLKAVRVVLQGGVHVSERISTRLLSGLASAAEGELPRIGVERLSDRELEVFELIGRGLSTRQISDNLKVSVKTAESHRANIKRKLKLRSSSELAHRAIRWVEQEQAGH